MNIPKNLLKEAQKVSGASTKTKAVILGLYELIDKKHIESLINLKGSGALHISKKKIKEMRNR